jgi:hypothetical protein
MNNALRSQSRPLIAGLSAAGVVLGDEVEAAIRAQADASTTLAPYQLAYQQAKDALLTCAGKDFGKRSQALIKVTAEYQAAVTAAPVITEAAEFALIQRLNERLDDYEHQLVTAFDKAVAAHDLNTVAPALPELTVDGFRLDVLSLSEESSYALLAWKRGASVLHRYWDGYVRIASYRGFTLGPSSVDSLWSNRLTSVALGATSANQTLSASTIFAAHAAGSENARQIRELLPFITSAVFGWELKLRPVQQADSILRSMNAVHAPGALPVGVS